MSLPTLPSTNDGHVHRAISWHQYPGLANTTTDHDRAVAVARQVDIICTQFNRLQGFAGDMFTANSSLLLIPYQKIVQFPQAQQLGGANTNVGQLPYRWFGHSDWTGSLDANLCVGGFFGIDLMMADTVNDDHSNVSSNPSNISTWWVWAGTDRLGNAVTYFNWKEMNSRYCASDVTNENNRYANDPWRGMYYDSAGAFAYSSVTPKPVHRNGTVYTDGTGAAHAYLVDAAWPMGDQAIADNPNLLIWANGVDVADNPYLDVADHFHGMLMEGVFSPTTPTDYPTEASFKTASDVAMKVQVTGGTIAGGKNIYLWAEEKANGSTWSTATWNNYRRFLYAWYFFANRGKLWVEYQRGTGSNSQTASHIAPYLEYGEDPALYDLAMGVPLDTQNVTNSYGVGGQAGLYARRFTTGLVLVNFNASSRTFTADRTYTLLNAPGQTGVTTINSGAGITVPGVAADGTVAARFYTTSAAPPPPFSSVQDRIISAQLTHLTGAAVTGTAAPSTASESLVVGGASFRAGFETGNTSEFTSTNGSAISVLSGHAHGGIYAARVLQAASGANYVQKNLTPVLSLYGRVWFSITELFNGLTQVAGFSATGGNNQPTLRTNSAGDLIAALAPKNGSATAAQSRTLYTLDPATDIVNGSYFRFEWFCDFTNGTTGFLHAWLFNETGGLLGSTGTNLGNTTGTPLSFTGADYVQSTIFAIRGGVVNSTPTNGTLWVDDIAYNAASLGRVG